MQQKHRVRTNTLYTKVNWAFALVMFSTICCPERPEMTVNRSIIIKYRTNSKTHNTSLLLSETVAQQLQHE